jgi:NAD(P)H-dependent FMN reductase
MKNILAFAGSNSSKSINQELLEFVTEQIDLETDIIKLTDYPISVYGIDHELNEGIPENTIQLHKKIKVCDILIISLNEHNGGASVFFKNHIDWLSRHDRSFLENKKLFLLSTSPGRGGAKMALNWAAEVLPRFGAEIVSKFSLASFNHAYSKKDGIFDLDQKQAFDSALNQLSIHF